MIRDAADMKALEHDPENFSYFEKDTEGETPHGSVAYQTIFAVAALLFVMPLLMDVISHRLSRRLRAAARA